MFEPATPHAGQIRDLFFLVLAITGAIFVVVEGLLVYCIVRFRRRPREVSQEPPQIYGSRPVEVAWTTAPLLVVFVLFLVVFRSLAELRQHHPPEDAERVRVIGHQWWWEFDFPDAGAIVANELHLPLASGEKPIAISLELESADVIHSFWVPRLSGKTDVVPGRINRMWFETESAGEFLGQCAEYCGVQHGNMLLRVVVEPEEDFRRWLAGQSAPAFLSEEQNAAEGRRIFLSLACVNCHAIRGTPAKGTFGPDLTHLMSRKTLAAGAILNDAANLRKWLDDPQVAKPGCNMPDMHLSPEQIERLVDFLSTLK